MSNIINTQNFNSNNPVFMRNNAEENISRFSQAPVSIPKYSINDVLKERDEFRKTVTKKHYENVQKEETKSCAGKFFAMCAAVCAFLVLESKKII